MKKLLITFICVLLLVCAASCGIHEREPEANDQLATTIAALSTSEALLPTTPKPLNSLDYDRSKVGTYSEKAIAFSKANARNVNVKYHYPQLTDIKDKTKQQKINEFIQQTILELCGVERLSIALIFLKWTIE